MYIAIRSILQQTLILWPSPEINRLPITIPVQELNSSALRKKKMVFENLAFGPLGRWPNWVIFLRRLGYSVPSWQPVFSDSWLPNWMNIVPIDKLLLAKTYTCLVVFRFVIFRSKQSFHGLCPISAYEVPLWSRKISASIISQPC